MACNNTDTDNCGCSHQHSAKCSFYYGDALSCIDVVYGDDLQVALENINTAVCNLTPSGSVTIVEPCDANIAITSSTVGQTTTYTVCLNSDITYDIETNTNNISTINTCLSDTVASLVSYDDSILIQEVGSNSCGKLYNITTVTPSGTPRYDGIIYNDTGKTGCSNVASTQLLKYFDWDYENKNLLTEGDEVRFRLTGMVTPSGENTDEVIIEFWDTLNNLQLFTQTYSNFSPADSVIAYSWLSNISLTRMDTTIGEGLLHVEFIMNKKEAELNGNFVAGTCIVINKPISTVIWTNLQVRVYYIHNATGVAGTYNYARQVMAEVRKLTIL